MIPVRQSTAFECSIGPVLDADGVAVTDCVVGDFKIKKTTGNFAALNGSATLTHVSAGVYDLVLTTSDVDTVGLATVAIDDTTNACEQVRLQVVEEAVYDALYAAAAAGYQIPIWSSAGATVNLSATTVAVAAALTANNDKTGYGLADGAITAAKIASDAFTAAKFHSDVTTEFQNGLATATALATAQADLDTITGSDGVTLATTQGNYAPATAAALASLVTTVGVAGAGLTEAGGTGDHLTALATQTSVNDLPTNAELATALAAADDAVLAAIAALENLSAAEAETAVTAALVAMHLDHLLAATYDPSSKPGAADALLNAIVENDGGVPRLTENSLELAPSGGGGGDATEANQDLILAAIEDISGDVYEAEVDYRIDEANTQDEYTIRWFKNRVRITSGITSPTLTVVTRGNSTLINAAVPTQIGSTGAYKHDATGGARLTAGEAAEAVVTATIDGEVRTFSWIVGRDSTA